MGRHRAERSNSGIAKELIYAVIAAVVVLALLVGWLMLRDRNSESHTTAGNCPAGTITVPTALIGGAGSLKSLQEEYLQTKPVIKDYCVSEFTDADVKKAALVYTESGDQATKKALQGAKKSAATSQWPIVGLSEIGIAVPQEKNPADFGDWATVSDVAFINDDALSGTIAKQAMNTSPATTIPRDKAVAEKKAFVTASSEVPNGYTFVVPQQPSLLQLPTRAMAIATSEGVSEEQSRAAAAFLEFAASKTTKLEGPAAQAVDQAVKAAPLPAAEAQAPQAAPKKSDTLVVLDTSDQMAPQYPAVSASLAERITRLGAANFTVGLWNYSSPLSAGVASGWRPNVPLTDASNGANAATAVTRFGTGGSPYTHEAVVAALNHAQEVAASNNKPVKVVLVTAGTADAGSQGKLAAALQGVDRSKVSLHIVNLGVDDAELSEWAKNNGGSVRSAKTDAELDTAIDKALGL
ncbi:vWA domain-containing protein [Corynebacterium sp. H130]|uniref:vWA domain-containing protein n=1 Tax=Corynebacterium sp. H130 TaxID=3133444 RepID=UPI0030B0EB80